MKYVIWNNDVCKMYDSIKAEAPDQTDDEIWESACEEIERWFDDERSNLDSLGGLNAPIVALAEIQRWSGKYNMHRFLGNRISCCLTENNTADNSVELYVEGKDLMMSMRGHDNPVSPSIIVFRKLRKGTSKDIIEDLLANNDMNGVYRRTVPLGNKISKIYGWK